MKRRLVFSFLGVTTVTLLLLAIPTAYLLQKVALDAEKARLERQGRDVLDGIEAADPTQDIRNSDNIDMVMLNGRLYDAETLNETATGTRQRQPYYWEQDGGAGAPAGAQETDGSDED